MIIRKSKQMFMMDKNKNYLQYQAINNAHPHFNLEIYWMIWFLFQWHGWMSKLSTLSYVRDDIKIYMNVKTPKLCETLQGYLDRLSGYYVDNHTGIILKKCSYNIIFTRNKHPIVYHYGINNFNLLKVNSAVDLRRTIN